MYIIIGAGPAGLYTALALVKAGVEAKNIVIYDPRANHYTRPGECLGKTFRNAQHRFNLQYDECIFQKRVPSRAARLEGARTVEYAHISDFEKTLYAKAVELGISIEKKYFISIENHGVTVKNSEGIHELILGDYVFDCSGPYRQVVNAVNKVCPNQPFRLQEVTTYPIPNHFIAYVSMAKQDFSTLQDSVKFSDNLSFVSALFKLNEFGWNEFKFPNCWGGSFGENKACLYMEMPPNLAKEHHTTWFETILALYGPSIKYQRLPDSTEYPSTTTFTAFSIKGEALEKTTYKMNSGVKVIALGDAQVSANYELAHGIYNGMNRIDAMVAAMTIKDGKIHSLDEDQYESVITSLLSKHKQELKEYAEQSRRSIAAAKVVFHRALFSAEMANRVKPILSSYATKLSLFKNNNALEREDINLKLAQSLMDLIIKEVRDQIDVSSAFKLKH